MREVLQTDITPTPLPTLDKRLEDSSLEKENGSREKTETLTSGSPQQKS